MLIVSRRIMISAPRETVRRFLRELRVLPEYDRKVTRVALEPEEGAVLRAQIAGRLLFIPWQGSFQVGFEPDGGWRADQVKGTMREVRFLYHLRPVAGGTILTHEEAYQLPLLMRPMSPIAGRWLAHEMDLELGVIKEGAERLHRRIQLDEIESLA